jgi:hypothetical protein
LPPFSAGFWLGFLSDPEDAKDIFPETQPDFTGLQDGIYLKKKCFSTTAMRT